MPDMERLQQIQMIAQIISTLPPQKPGGVRIPLAPAKTQQWAPELYDDFGIRVHAELAKKMIVSDGSGTNAQLGNMATKHVVDVVDLNGILNLLRSHPDVPSLAELADQIQDALGDPEKEAALRAQIGKTHPDVVATAKQIIDRTPPAAFEQ
jgi:hypothetical protein